ncbi:MAG: hypothetical protein Q9164_000689 [Protoblastenia rupestris]
MATGQAVSPVQMNDVVEVIAQEVRVSTSELSDAADFAELGIDDVLATHIICKIKERLSLDLPNATLTDHPNIQELESYIEKITERPAKSTQSLPAAAKATPDTIVKPVSRWTVPLSVLLQGNIMSAKKTIFLLPDGSGSGMAYAKFPHISPNVCLIGLNSPFLNAADEFTTTIEELAVIWAKEVRNRQPAGPYILGGWSAGGYYSYEVAKQLQRENETVEKLILIDSPCRLRFEPLPMEVIYFLAAQGLLGNWGSKKTPDWFVSHFKSTIEAVAKYNPSEMVVQRSMPQVYIIWAEEGVLQNKDITATGLDLSVDITRFMLEDKKNFGLHGWDRLFSGTTASIVRSPGNHFTMVHPPNSNSFGTLLQDVLHDRPFDMKHDWQVVDL